MTQETRDFIREWSDHCRNFRPSGPPPGYLVTVTTERGEFTFIPAVFRWVGYGTIEMVAAAMDRHPENRDE